MSKVLIVTVLLCLLGANDCDPEAAHRDAVKHASEVAAHLGTVESVSCAQLSDGKRSCHPDDFQCSAIGSFGTVYLRCDGYGDHCTTVPQEGAAQAEAMP